jgi:hypothetical protein
VAAVTCRGVVHLPSDSRSADAACPAVRPSASRLAREAAIKPLDAINGDAAIGLLIMPLIVAYGLSVILLPIAFYRRRLVPLWVVGLAGTAFVLEVVAPGGVLAVAGVKYALAAVAATALAWRITQLSNSEWRNPETIDRTWTRKP